jgi:hypothetical protein
MPCKCPCCPGKKNSSDGYDNNFETEQRIEKEIEEKVHKNFQILREDIYENLMKKYFATGQDHRQFSRLFLDSNTNAAAKKTDRNRYDKNKKEKEGTFY